MADIGRAKVPVEFDKAQIAKDADAAITPAIEGAVQSAAKLAGGILASKALFNFGKEGLEEFSENQRVAAQSSIALRNETNITQQDIDSLGQSMLDLAGFDDEAAASAANILLRFGAIHDAETLKRVEEDAADLAIAMGTDLTSAAQTLGQVLQDPENAARKLRPIIGSLTDEQKESIKAFTDQGDAAGAQAVILGVLEERIGGAAAAYGDELPASLDRAEQSIENAKASLVEGLTPAIDFGASAATTLAEGIEGLPGPLRTVASVAVGTGVAVVGLIEPIGGLVQSFNSLKTARALSAVQAEVNAAASLKEAGALTVEAEAALAANAAQGKGAGGALGLTKALGPLALAAGVAAIAIAGITSEGEHLDIELSELAKASDDELDRVFRSLQTTFGGDLLDDFIDQLVRGGEEGVGMLVRLREGMEDTDPAAAKLDAAIGKAQEQFANAATNADAARGALDGFSSEAGDTSGVDAAAEAAKELADQIGEVEAAALRLAPADVRARRGSLAVADAQDRAAEAAEKLAEAQASGDPTAVERAQRDLERANLDLESSVLDLAQSQADLREAELRAAGAKDEDIDQTGLLDQALTGLVTQFNGPTRTALEGHIADLDRARDDVEKLTAAENGLEAAAAGAAAGGAFGGGGFGASGAGGDFPRRAFGGEVPAFQPFRHSEHGIEVAVLDRPGVSAFSSDAFVFPNGALGGNGGKGGVVVNGGITLGSRDDLPALSVELKRLSLSSRH